MNPELLADGRSSHAPASPLRVVVADDSDGILRRLENFVEALGTLTVVATASNGHDAWNAIVQLKPDLALLDFQMPGLTGLEIAGRVRTGELSTRVVIFSIYEGPEVRSSCLAAGADGFIPKHQLSAELLVELARLGKPDRGLVQHNP